MKYLVLILCFLFTLGVDAQSSFGDRDTVVNTATVNLDESIKGSAENLAIQVIVGKISGTVAGTCVLYGSLNDTAYVAIGADSLSLTDVSSQSKIWDVAPSKYRYYRVGCTGSGTMSAKVNGFYLQRE